MSASLTAAIKQAARELGFDVVGISALPSKPLLLAEPRSLLSHRGPRRSIERMASTRVSRHHGLDGPRP